MPFAPPWISASLLQEPWLFPLRLAAWIFLLGLGCALWRNRRRELLLVGSLVALALFLGPWVLFGQILFVLGWWQCLRHFESRPPEERGGVTAVILGLAALFYFGLMNLPHFNPTLDLLSVQALGLAYLFWRVIHVTVDWKRGSIPAPGLLLFSLYVFYFPTLRGGPIERYPDFSAAPFFTDPNWRPQLEGGPLLRIGGGMAKLLLCHYFLSLDYSQLWQQTATLPYGVLLKILYTRALTFYAIASGTNDLTLSFSRMLGIPLSENYDYPYLRRNLAEFWKSWHITLSSCLKDYIYEPLGGRRKHQSLNYLLTFLVCACWHVVSPAFLLWGLMHGGGLVVLRLWQNFWRSGVERLGSWGTPLRRLRDGLRARPRLGQTLSTLFTFHYVALSWLPFWGGHPQGTQAILRLLGF